MEKVVNAKGRKGISPLIATVLLIVFTVAVASIFMSWLRDYTGKTQTGVDVSSSEILDCGQQSVEIKDVYMLPKSESLSTDKYRISISNTGTRKTTLLDAFLITTSGEKCTFSAAASYELAAGGSVVLENADCGDVVDLSHNCRKFYRAEVKTACGSEFFNRYERPVCNSTRVVLSEYE